eukprot:349990-Chlamydomonas_euryale.AAC.11
MDCKPADIRERQFVHAQGGLFQHPASTSGLPAPASAWARLATADAVMRSPTFREEVARERRHGLEVCQVQLHDGQLGVGVRLVYGRGCRTNLGRVPASHDDMAAAACKGTRRLRSHTGARASDDGNLA